MLMLDPPSYRRLPSMERPLALSSRAFTWLLTRFVKRGLFPVSAVLLKPLEQFEVLYTCVNSVLRFWMCTAG